MGAKFCGCEREAKKAKTGGANEPCIATGRPGRDCVVQGEFVAIGERCEYLKQESVGAIEADEARAGW
jgi:hypothetical protein